MCLVAELSLEQAPWKWGIEQAAGGKRKEPVGNKTQAVQ